jgi:hypothetical protein
MTLRPWCAGYPLSEALSARLARQAGVGVARPLGLLQGLAERVAGA